MVSPERIVRAFCLLEKIDKALDRFRDRGFEGFARDLRQLLATVLSPDWDCRDCAMDDMLSRVEGGLLGYLEDVKIPAVELLAILKEMNDEHPDHKRA